MARNNFESQMDARMRKAVRLTLNSIGRDGVKLIRGMINVPVQYFYGPRWGKYVERSDPGEPPRREFRVLQKSIKYKTEPKAKTVEDLSIYSTAKYAPYLEYGTENMEARPFFAPARRQMGSLKALFKRRLAERLKEMPNS